MRITLVYLFFSLILFPRHSLGAPTSDLDTPTVNQPTHVIASEDGHRLLAWFDYAGLWKSEDAGESWRGLMGEFPWRNDVRLLQMGNSDSDADTLYLLVQQPSVASYLYTSRNGGDQWTLLLPDQKGLFLSSFVIDQKDPNHLFGYSLSSIAESRDAGSTWTIWNKKQQSLTSITTMWLDPDEENRWLQAGNYRATPAAGGIIESLDGGRSWDISSPLFELDLHFSIQHAIPLHVLLLSNNSYLMDIFSLVPQNPTMSLMMVDQAFEHPEPISNTFPVGGHTSFIHESRATAGEVYTCMDRVYRSDDWGLSWDLLAEEGLPKYPGGALMMTSTGKATYLPLRTQGLFCKSAASDSWQKISTPPIGTYGAILLDEGRIVYDPGSNREIFSLKQNSNQWDRLNRDGLPNHVNNYKYSFDVFGDTIYSSFRSLPLDPNTENSDPIGHVLVSLDNGKSWNSIASHPWLLNNIYSNHRQDTPVQASFPVKMGSTIAVSLDRGSNWKIIPLPEDEIYQWPILILDSEIVLASPTQLHILNPETEEWRAHKIPFGPVSRAVVLEKGDSSSIYLGDQKRLYLFSNDIWTQLEDFPKPAPSYLYHICPDDRHLVALYMADNEIYTKPMSSPTSSWRKIDWSAPAKEQNSWLGPLVFDPTTSTILLSTGVGLLRISSSDFLLEDGEKQFEQISP